VAPPRKTICYQRPRRANASSLVACSPGLVHSTDCSWQRRDGRLLYDRAVPTGASVLVTSSVPPEPRIARAGRQGSRPPSMPTTASIELLVSPTMTWPATSPTCRCLFTIQAVPTVSATPRPAPSRPQRGRWQQDPYVQGANGPRHYPSREGPSKPELELMEREMMKSATIMAAAAILSIAGQGSAEGVIKGAAAGHFVGHAHAKAGAVARGLTGQGELSEISPVQPRLDRAFLGNPSWPCFRSPS
jgi:hypothetical protein